MALLVNMYHMYFPIMRESAPRYRGANVCFLSQKIGDERATRVLESAGWVNPAKCFSRLG